MPGKSRKQFLEDQLARIGSLTKEQFQELQALRARGSGTQSLEGIRVDERRQEQPVGRPLGERDVANQRADRINGRFPVEKERAHAFEKGLINSYRAGKPMTPQEASDLLGRVSDAITRIQRGDSTLDDHILLQQVNYRKHLDKVSEDLTVRQYQGLIRELGQRDQMVPADRLSEWSDKARVAQQGARNAPYDVREGWDREAAVAADDTGRAYQRLAPGARPPRADRGQPRPTPAGPNDFAGELPWNAATFAEGDPLPGYRFGDAGVLEADPGAGQEAEIRRYANEGPDTTIRQMVTRGADRATRDAGFTAMLREPEFAPYIQTQFGPEATYETLTAPQQDFMRKAVVRDPALKPVLQAVRDKRARLGLGQTSESSAAVGPQEPSATARVSQAPRNRLDRLYDLQDRIGQTFDDDEAMAALSPYEQRQLRQQYLAIDKHIGRIEQAMQDAPDEGEFWDHVTGQQQKQGDSLPRRPYQGMQPIGSGEMVATDRLLSRLDPESGVSVEGIRQSNYPRMRPGYSSQSIPLQPDEQYGADWETIDARIRERAGGQAPQLLPDSAERTPYWDYTDPESAPSRPTEDRYAASSPARRPGEIFSGESQRPGVIGEGPLLEELLPIPGTETGRAAHPAPLQPDAQAVALSPGRAPARTAGSMFSDAFAQGGRLATGLGRGANALGITTSMLDLFAAGRFTDQLKQLNSAGGIPIEGDLSEQGSHSADSFGRVQLDPFTAFLAQFTGMDRNKFVQDPAYRQQWTGVGIS